MILKKSLLTQSDPTSVDQLPYEVDIQAIPSAPELPDLPPAFAPSAPPLPPHNELTLDHTLIATPNAAHDQVKEWFIAYPGLINLRINPVKLDGSVESRYVIGVKGSLYSARSGRIGRPRSIDWSATLERVMDIANEHIHSSVNDAIERIRNWYLTHPEWASLKVQPINRTGGQSSRYYIGARGELHDLRTGERTINLDYDSPEAIDWLATESHIRRMYSDGASNSIDELGEMRREDASAPPPPPPPRPAPSLSYDQAQELLEQIRDQDDSRAAMNEHMASHPDEEVTLVPSSGRADGIDWVATHNHLLDSSAGPGVTTEELLSQLDEEARSRSSSEPEVARMLEDIVDDVAVTQLPSTPERRPDPRLIERGNRLLRQAHAIVSRAKR